MDITEKTRISSISYIDHFKEGEKETFQLCVHYDEATHGWEDLERCQIVSLRNALNDMLEDFL